MPAWICQTCGTQFEPSDEPPERCPICEDERQYVGWGGQKWTTLEELAWSHKGRVEPENGELIGIGVTPEFAIGQRALLVRHPAGNVLWDCVPLLPRMADWVEALGGLEAIAISHPHYYSTMVEWAGAFDVPVYLHAADRSWVQRHDPRLRFWDGDDLELLGDLRLIRLGGHFPGGQVLHWPAGAAGAGALLTGDVIQVVQDRRWVSFMYSYPNLVPLSALEVRAIVTRLQPYAFDRLYGAWWGRVVRADARGAVLRSAERYIRWLEGAQTAGSPRSPRSLRSPRSPRSPR